MPALSNRRNRIAELVKKSPVVAGTVAMGVGVLSSGDADAQLIFTNIDQTADNSTIFIDIDGGGVDFAIKDQGSSATIDGIGKANRVFNKAGNKAKLFSLGDTISSTSGSTTSSPVLLYGGGGPWDPVGAKGYAGLELASGKYGWVHLERGSITAGLAAYHNIVGNGALIAVPEASSLAHLALLACGAAGLGALRRRKSASSEEAS